MKSHSKEIPEKGICEILLAHRGRGLANILRRSASSRAAKYAHEKVSKEGAICGRRFGAYCAGGGASCVCSCKKLRIGRADHRRSHQGEKAIAPLWRARVPLRRLRGSGGRTGH